MERVRSPGQEPGDAGCSYTVTGRADLAASPVGVKPAESGPACPHLLLAGSSFPGRPWGSYAPHWDSPAFSTARCFLSPTEAASAYSPLSTHPACIPGLLPGWAERPQEVSCYRSGSEIPVGKTQLSPVHFPLALPLRPRPERPLG